MQVASTNCVSLLAHCLYRDGVNLIESLGVFCWLNGDTHESYKYTIFAAYNQQDATFHNLFISVRCSTCFRRVFRPSSGAQNWTYSVRYLSDQYLTLYVQF